MSTSCLLDEEGLGGDEGDGDGDADVDTDGDADSDADTDFEEDADPDDEDADPDEEEDADPDVDEAFRIVSVSNTLGFTCGWALDPRTAAQKNIEIRYTGRPFTDDLLNVSIGDGIIVSEPCGDSNDEQCFAGPIPQGTSGTVTIRYPLLDVEADLTMTLVSETDNVEHGELFLYRVLDLDPDLDTPATAGESAVTALLPGCFRDPRGAGFHCDPGGYDVVSTLGEAHDDGLFRLFHAIGEGVQTATLSTWSGDAGLGVRAIANIFAGRPTGSGASPGVITMGDEGLRVHTYAREPGEFQVNSVYTCMSIPGPTAGLAAGDFHQGTGWPGEEMVLLVWRRSSDDLIVYVHPTYQTSRNCNFRDSLVFELPADAPTGGEPIEIRPASEDLDGDGNLDLAFGILGAGMSPQFVVLWGDGMGDFAAESTQVALAPECGRPGQVLMIDLDRDSDLDAVVGCSDSESLEVLSNSGGRGFEASSSQATSLPEGGGSALVAVGYLDPDRLPDLVVAQRATGNITVLQGGGRVVGFAFRPPLALPRLSLDIESLAVADLDDNGFQDVVVGGVGASGGEVAVVWMEEDL